MSDRPEHQRSDPSDDDLAYLDAGLTDEAPAGTGQAGPPRQRRPLADAETPPEREEVATAPAPPVRLVEPEPVAVEMAPAMDRHWFWPLVNAVGLLVVIAVNALANVLEFNDQSTGDVVNKDPVPFQPAGWVFSIWGVIYALLIAFVLYGLLPAGRRNVRLQRISPFFLVANLANVTWLFLWHWEQFLASLVTIVVLLAALLAIYVGLRMRNPFRRSIPAESPTLVQRFVLWLPFSVYLGWVCVATLANLMVWLDRTGWDGGPFSYRTWAVLFMLAATAVAAAFAVLARDAIIPLVLAVAFAGITQRAWDDAKLVAVFGIVFALLNLLLAGVAWIVSYDRNAARGSFGVSESVEAAPPMTPVEGPPSQRS